MSGVLLWGWDSVNGVWREVIVDSSGRINIGSVADAEISQDTPQSLKHVPHGYYAAGPSYLPLAVDSAGKLLLTLSSLAHLDDIDDVSVAAPTDGYILYWDAATSLWKCKALPAAAWAAITGKPTSPSLEELATEHDAAGLHTGMIVLADADIPAAIARDAEVATAVSDHTALPSAHHVKYTDAEAKAAAVLAGAITDGETKAPTHDAVYDVKATADGAIPKSLLTERGSVIFRNASAPAELLHGTVGQVLQSGGHGADPSWASAPSGTKITDADGDTKIDVEESADEDKIRMDVKGVEAFLLDDAGVLTLAKQSACRAENQTSDQTISDLTATKVIISSESYDLQNEFDPVTNYRFTAKTAGVYLIISQVQYLASIDQKPYQCRIHKNGALVQAIQTSASGTAPPPVQNQMIAFLAVNDYIELYTWHNAGTSQILRGTDHACWLAIAKIA